MLIFGDEGVSGFMKEKRSIAVLLFSLMALAAGCAAKAPQQAAIVYPAPPDEPRIAYIASYVGEDDFRSRGFFDPLLDWLFGKKSPYDLIKPYGVASHGEKIYVADSGNASVLVFDRQARTVSRLGSGVLAVPVGVAAAADGTVFVSDIQKHAVVGFNELGNATVTLGPDQKLKNPAGLAVNNGLGRLYVSDTLLNTVFVYTLKGEFLFKFQNGEKAFGTPTNIAVDGRNGNVYVTETINFRVLVMDKDGKFLRSFGQLGDVPGTFARPRGVAVDSEGHVYVVDAAFDNFQIFDEKGQLLLFLGSAGGGPGTFLLPAGIYVDEQDRIYVADTMNRRVQVFQYLSDKWKKEHPEEYKKYLLD